jgi:ABC-type transport system involved in multi-copper enzyme maturation permease subunit
VFPLVKIIKTEFKKLKGSNILWICLVACFMLPIMSLFVGKNVPRSFDWMNYCTQSMWMSVLLLWPCIFGLMGTYIFTRERIENTYKNLFIIPVGRIQLILSKLIVLFATILGITFLSYLLNLSGLLIGVKITINSFLYGLTIYLLVGCLTFAAMLPVFFIALISKKGFLISVCITIVYAIASFIAIWSPLLSSLMPIVTILRICNITTLQIDYAFPLSVNVFSMGIIALGSFAGLIFAARRQEA